MSFGIGNPGLDLYKKVHQSKIDLVCDGRVHFESSPVQNTVPKFALSTSNAGAGAPLVHVLFVSALSFSSSLLHGP